MPKILLIDDDPHLRNILSKVLTSNEFEVFIAEDGASGLRQAKKNRPDLIILDIIMPGMDGFEVAQRLHNDPICSRIPIMILTAYATPYGRKTAVELGVDDFMTKPFGVEDVVSKVRSMTSAPDRAANQTTVPLKAMGQARIIAIHTQRGGLGCTSLAINLATAFKNIWQLPTLLLDGDFPSGQVALALDWPAALGWSDLMQASMANTVHRLLDDQRIAHEDGLHVLTAPRDPKDAERVNLRVVGHSLRLLEQRYDYVVADLAHDLRDNTFELLKSADRILHLVAPDAVSLQLARKTLARYAARGIQPEQIELVLVDTRPGKPPRLNQVELAVGRSISAYIPYTADMTGAINRGLPFVDACPDHKLTALLEDMAYLLSKPLHQNREPDTPSQSYLRAHVRLNPAGRRKAQKDPRAYLLKRVGIKM